VIDVEMIQILIKYLSLFFIAELNILLEIFCMLLDNIED